MEKKLLMSVAALSAIGLSNAADAARNDKQSCAPEPGVCYSESCDCYYCLGPTQIGVNPSVRPKTCNGDLVITLAGFYWNANQDGMEYAVEDQVEFPVEITNATAADAAAQIQNLNNLIDAKYKTPDFKWDFGFKVGLAYNTTCDGWDVGVLWTWYRGSASSHDEAEPDDNRVLLPLWSAFAPLAPVNRDNTVYASDIQTHWKLNLNLVDIELGREFWTSKYLTFRPHIGLRIAYIKQEFEIEHKGGSWSAKETVTTPLTALQPAFNNMVDLENKFHGVGVRGGFDTVWNLGCGWAFYGNLAASIVYGRFKVDHDEENRLASGDHAKTKILETHDSFRSSRGILDLNLGVQWGTMFCECQYGLTVMLGWEHHMFFDQNQMWRVVRIADAGTNFGQPLPNNTGENIFQQRRGDLSTQGWTLTLRFEF